MELEPSYISVIALVPVSNSKCKSSLLCAFFHNAVLLQIYLVSKRSHPTKRDTPNNNNGTILRMGMVLSRR